ncbi:rho guanyl nucleotide exchange factor [Cordyceps fumosorosea ARSEF 2679]|uniref:Rho guanyl nucleotide exchange factor n=1 Tax=Cordyceps fumosorosea (strain ARSEF 2679) TaxID=1081104 RepID=A0A167S6Z8_CORFA|nr:rho guanyl nucleotide exchange factor [Cordyceps fumosorosea ARSEF 2679]OAA59322.1 rho guanyl nucleotide exchange factor [Cordyceps fumosorosea ARSEF 2679]
MVRVTDDTALATEQLVAYHASDPLLGHLPIVVLYGASTTANHTHNSSRVQIHVLSPAGLRSFPRLTISPNSPFYGVVARLPREFQGDEVYRALAFGLFRCFAELPEGVRAHLRSAYPTRGRGPTGADAPLFSEQHVANVVATMVPSDNTHGVVSAIQDALQPQHVSNLDLDLILPPGSIVPLQDEDLEDVPEDEDDILDPTLRQYAGYTPLVKLFGEPVFIPTSRLRRAPSKPTSINKSKTFTVEQKIELRMKLAELVDTEERYVLKLNELAHSVVDRFRDGVQQREGQSLNAAEAELAQLFPGAADEILKLNSTFLRELQNVMDETEEEALVDMEGSSAQLMSPRQAGTGRPKDPIGALAMAKVFLEWFPKFSDCYRDYIKASQHFPTSMDGFLDPQATAQRGDQATKSALIEPVQRLPRYSLLIDQIVASLPITHPALQSMLKARDIITNICSLDTAETTKPQLASQLRNIVEAWPADLEPKGRLIGAADFIELSLPFEVSLSESDNKGILLLFADCVAVLKKTGRLTGRDLLREIGKPSAAELLISMTNAAGGSAAYEFAFTGWHDLASVRFTESANGSFAWMTSTQNMKGVHTGEHRISAAPTARCFLLQELYEGKASRWAEDVTRARIEARFSESERENPSWTLRSIRMPDSNLGLHAAVFQEGADQLIEGRREPAAVRVVIDHEKGTKGAPVGHYGVEIVITVATNDMRRISMITAGLHGKQYEDIVALEDLIPTMSRRIIQLLNSQFNVANMDLTAAMVSYNSKILRSLNFSAQTTPIPRAERTRSFLSASPVKLLSNLWGGGTTGNNTVNSNAAHGDSTASVDSIISTTTVARQPSLHRSNSHHSILGSIRGERSFIEDTPPDNPILRLEETFTAYVAALQERKGAISGRTMLNRSSVDEVLVNDVYNRLIENPYDFELPLEVSTEVIFVAFENFLRIAWKEQMGAVMSKQAMVTLQDRANRRALGDFADFVRYLFSDMAPQNRRAVASLIKLLSYLLDGCSDDGDRGALTIAFAELLVMDGTASHYINLLDRLVEDCDRIFGSVSPNQSFSYEASTLGSIRSATLRKEVSMTGSVASNTSSLRKKFGLESLMRQNKDDRPERPSVWRSLSKHRNPATGEPSSISRRTMRHGLMGEDGTLPRLLQRGNSARERPTVAGAFDAPSRPTSSHRAEFPLNTIGEPQHESATPSRFKHKRRSSLSDLKSLMEAASLDDEGDTTQPLQLSNQTPGKANTPAGPRLQRDISGCSQQKENTNAAGSVRSFDSGREPSKMPSPVKSVVKHAKALSVSSIPMLKPVQLGPFTAGSAGKSSGRLTRSPARIRLQSPQRLRDRVQTSKTAVYEASKALRAELQRTTDQASHGDASASKESLEPVHALSDKLNRTIQELQAKYAALQEEMDTTLKATEVKMRSIDQQHKEVSAENELIYEKFNDELGKIVKALRSKGKEEKEELIGKIKEHSEESAKLRRENGRLKRENISLRALLKQPDQS